MNNEDKKYFEIFVENYDPAIWGTVSSWVSGLLTALTVGVGVWTIYTSNKRFQKEVKERADASKAREDAREKQLILLAREEAAQVYLWVDVNYDRSGARVERLELNVANRSLTPIYEWTAYSEDKNINISSENFGLLAPGATEVDLLEYAPALRNIGWKRNQIPRMCLQFKASNGEIIIRNADGSFKTIQESPQ